jgi:hypothetical protein
VAFGVGVLCFISLEKHSQLDGWMAGWALYDTSKARVLRRSILFYFTVA